MTTTVGIHNLLPIPPEVAAEFGLYDGARVEWVRGYSGNFEVRPAPDRAPLAQHLKGAGANPEPDGSSIVDEILAEDRAELTQQLRGAGASLRPDGSNVVEDLLADRNRDLESEL